ncbi:zinc ribbon domain-containing protein [Spiroplasma endosymbiont of Nebria brevicollis]|uniref:zinc ribbon domain-containing protein n=1 Tax=Spiroplasma endosymbiont of Nebria brevicollis TaxID=3066284 RepID=UPI00313E949D
MNKVYKNCQSCNMSIKKDNDKGIEWDKSLSTIYCKNCYDAGKFRQPSITVREMQEQVYNMMKKHIPSFLSFLVNHILQKYHFYYDETPTLLIIKNVRN